MTALDGSVNQPIRDCMLLAGNSLLKIKAFQVVFYSRGQTARFTVWSNGKQNSVLKNFITEQRLPFEQISFIFQPTWQGQKGEGSGEGENRESGEKGRERKSASLTFSPQSPPFFPFSLSPTPFDACHFPVFVKISRIP